MTDHLVVVNREQLASLDGFHPCDDFDRAKDEMEIYPGELPRTEVEVQAPLYIQVISGCVMKLPTEEHIALRTHNKDGAVASPLTLIATAELKREHMKRSFTGALRTSIGKEMVEQFIVPFPRVTHVKPLGIILNRSGDSPAMSSSKVCFLFEVELEDVPNPANSPLHPTNTVVSTIKDITETADYDEWSAIYVAATNERIKKEVS